MKLEVIMSICDDCKDYDYKNNICIPCGEVAGNSVVYCAWKRTDISSSEHNIDIADKFDRSSDHTM